MTAVRGGGGGGGGEKMVTEGRHATFKWCFPNPTSPLCPRKNMNGPLVVTFNVQFLLTGVVLE